MAVVNSFARFFSATYPDQTQVVNTQPVYGDPINVFTPSYDPGAGGTIPSPADVRFGVPVGLTTGLAYIPTPGTVLLGVNVDQSIGTVRLPQAADVRSGIVFGPSDSELGTVVLPAEADVRIAVGYGSAGTEFTGLLDPGAGGVVPAASDVRLGVPVGATSGTLDLPAVSDVVLGVQFDNLTKTGTVRLPGVGDVRLNQAYGPSDSLSGTIVIPSAGDVRSGVSFEAGGASIGVLNLPAISDVRLAVSYDQGTKVGNVTIPLESDVRLGVTYDTLLSRTGALDPGGTVTPQFPQPSQVLDGVTYGTNENPTLYTGTLVVPAASNVLFGVTFGPGGSTVGRWVAASAGVVTKNVAFGLDGATLGTVVLPAATDVRLGVVYGDDSGAPDRTGLIQVPATTDVRDGVFYDSNGSQLGVYAPSPDYPAISDVRLGVVFGGGTGIYQPAAEDKVLSGYTYGANSEFVGTLQALGGEPWIAGDTVNVVRGDSYAAIAFENAEWPDLTGGTVKIGLYGQGQNLEFGCTIAGTVVNLALTTADTSSMRNWYWYDLQLTKDGAVTTLARGFWNAVDTSTDAPTNDPLPGGSPA